MIFTIAYSSTVVNAKDFVTDNKNGTVTVYFDVTCDETVKLTVRLKTQYQYVLKKGVNEIVVPLTEGNGEYQIKVAKELSANRYATIESAKVKLKLDDAKSIYVIPNVVVDYRLESLAIKKADELTGSMKDESKVIDTLYNYMVENFVYDYKKISGLQEGYIPDIDEVFKAKSGICYDYSAVFASMLRHRGIYSQLVVGYSTLVDERHAWNKVYDASKKKWRVIDTTVDAWYYEKKKNYDMIKDNDDYDDEKYHY